MKTPLARYLITLTVAASAALLAGCLEQTRQAAQPVPVNVAPPPASEPAILSRPDPSAANVTAPVAEIARLHQSGLDESVVKAFVERSTNSANPSADELIYLRDIGISPRIITALIQQTARMREHDAALRASQTVTAPAALQPNVTIIAANTTPPTPAAPIILQPAPPAVIAATPAPQVAVAAPADLPPQVNVFYQQLQPYGTWMQVADFGWCWQPSVAIATPSWRPYADRGRWLHTDSGWYWQSDYAWGWAPFHYGRWVQHTRSGWLWVPDTHWGPAWVVWRSSDSHCGWAPLPPSAVFVAGHGIHFGGTRVAFNFDFGLSRHHFTFVPFTRFCDRNPHYYALAPTVVQNVYNQTTVINNIQVNNNVVVNNGVSADRVALLTRTEIRKVAVREAGPQEQSLLRLDKLEKSGNDLVIYRPVLNPNAPVKPMLFTNSKDESRTELVPAGATPGAKIAGRPVYDTTSTGVPVLTGYTTEPPVTRANQNTVVINNHINAPPPPAPVISTSAETPANPRAATQPATAVKIFGITPSSAITKRAEERPQPRPTVILPSPAENSLFRPLTPPQPVTSTPPPVTSSAQNLPPPQPVATVQPATRTEFKKPQTTTAPVPAPTPRTPTPSYTAPVAPPRAPAVVPTYTPPPPRPSVQPQPAAPVAARPTVIVSPPPQPSSAPPSNNSSPSKTEQEKKK